ncbi:MAG TPA: bifunctional hydroxymethylpyrimidine kinase/phosphomethylpyrimidine kinase [Terriglobia bacterium]|nr:bifunctional hydroxymethylpyrimidine kinase/phosphomethylpyrimidine kinase [Terriglobia bacterium]
MIHNILSIAGSDPSGGAGIQADLKTFSALGAYGAAAITALTAQNTRGVAAVEVVSPDFIGQQIDAIFDDLRIDAVKIGMLANTEVIAVVADRLRLWQPRWIVLDPVMVAKSGHPLLDAAAIETLRRELLPLASIVTPNLPEAATLLDQPVAADWPMMEEAARQLRELGCPVVLLKGGHLGGATSPDLLLSVDGSHRFEAQRIESANTHGTGCTLSSAIAAYLPQARDIALAVAMAKDFVTGAIAAGDRLSVGHGQGPVHHFHRLWSDGDAARVYREGRTSD